MKTHRHWIGIVSAAVRLVGMATAWVIFIPAQGGSQVSYVMVVNGNSKE